jgi:hypothetical protein
MNFSKKGVAFPHRYPIRQRQRSITMPTETLQVSKDVAQTLHIEELVKHSAGLTVRLQVAETEVGKLHVVIERLEDGQLALSVKLEDANNEIGRLAMVLKHQAETLASIGRHPAK